MTGGPNNKDRRDNLEITSIILLAIADHGEKTSAYNVTSLNLTHLQLYTGLNYNNLKTRVLKLEQKNLITLNPISVTDRGFLFIHEYEIIQKSKQRLLDYTIESDIDRINARGPVTVQNQIKDYQQTLYAMAAVIEELENNDS